MRSTGCLWGRAGRGEAGEMVAVQGAGVGLEIHSTGRAEARRVPSMGKPVRSKQGSIAWLGVTGNQKQGAGGRCGWRRAGRWLIVCPRGKEWASIQGETGQGSCMAPC